MDNFISNKGKKLVCSIDTLGNAYYDRESIPVKVMSVIGNLATVTYKGAPFVGRLVRGRFSGRLVRRRRTAKQYRAPISTIYQHV